MNRSAFAVVLALVATAFYVPDAFAQSTPVLGSVVSTCGSPTYVAGQNRPFTQDTHGSQCTSSSGGGGGGTVTANQGAPNAGGATNSWPVQGAGTAGTPAGGVFSVQGVSGGQTLPVTGAQGAPNTVGNAWPVKNTDGTNVAAVKAASTAPVATDPALVVAVSPNGGQATAANQPTNAAQGSTTSGQTGPLNQCAVLSAAPTYTTAQTDPIVCGVKGQILTTTVGTSQIQNTSQPYSPQDIAGTTRVPSVAPFTYDGTNQNVAVGCTNSAAVSVTSGTTLQIVALSAGKQVRVCSFGLSISLAGTAQFEYGTGTNCGTGTTILTGAMNMTAGVPFTMNMAEGQLFASASSNALCIAAVTGNVNGFISYAVF